MIFWHNDENCDGIGLMGQKWVFTPFSVDNLNQWP